MAGGTVAAWGNLESSSRDPLSGLFTSYMALTFLLLVKSQISQFANGYS